MNHQNTNSTPWLESGSVPNGPGERGTFDVLALMHRLENTLLAAQRALLSRDLAVFEQQVAIQASIEDALQQAARDCPLLAQDVRPNLARALDLGRAYLVLVRRAQRSARVLANILAGAQCIYADLAVSPQPQITTSFEREV